MFGINKLRREIKAKQNLQFAIDSYIDTQVKTKFEEIGRVYDQLILTEANDIRKEWKELKKHIKSKKKQ